MRSVDPMPGNPWPHDMVLWITGDADQLLDLLWVRAAWGLAPPADAPPPPEVAPEPAPTVQSLRRDKRAWERAWSAHWTAALDSLGRPRDPDPLDAIEAAPLGSAERRRLLEDFRGPSWRGRFGDDGFDDRYDAWVLAVSRDATAEHRLPIEQHPERVCLDAVIVAWERGLQSIVTIPCVGEHTRTISGTALLVTRATRFDPDGYRRALRSFGR